VSALADRIRGIVAPRAKAREPGSTGPVVPSAVGPPASPERISEVLGGEWHHDADGTYLIVETRVAPATIYGRVRVGEIGDRLEEAAGDAAIIAGGAPARQPFLFVDVETTGLAGGAGTYAFLVGCGAFSGEHAFVTRQFVLTRFADERPLLGAVRAELARAGSLVSFNGKSFDAPLLETRYLFHRLEWIGGMLPHLDVLHPARRFWADIDGPHEYGVGRWIGRPTPPGCSLLALERHVLGVHREGDVPGFEIPARYFRFVRSGDARPLAAVLEHNRLDLLSLAGVTTRLLQLVRGGVEAARNAQEALGLGVVYSRAGLDGRAYDAYTQAVALADGGRAGQHSAGSIGGSWERVRITALRALALLSRRARRYDEAARFWEQLLQVRGCPPHVAGEATEALAIHHEHRVRDLNLAKSFALRSLEAGRDSARAAAARHRLARLDRKMQLSVLPLVFPSWSSPPSLPPAFGSRTSARRTSS
jgi:uncharacterized protein YprB with RNaseH-like and TPR domain